MVAPPVNRDTVPSLSLSPYDLSLPVYITAGSEAFCGLDRKSLVNSSITEAWLAHAAHCGRCLVDFALDPWDVEGLIYDNDMSAVLGRVPPLYTVSPQWLKKRADIVATTTTTIPSECDRPLDDQDPQIEVRLQRIKQAFVDDAMEGADLNGAHFLLVGFRKAGNVKARMAWAIPIFSSRLINRLALVHRLEITAFCLANCTNAADIFFPTLDLVSKERLKTISERWASAADLAPDWHWIVAAMLQAMEREELLGDFIDCDPMRRDSKVWEQWSRTWVRASQNFSAMRIKGKGRGDCTLFLKLFKAVTALSSENKIAHGLALRAEAEAFQEADRSFGGVMEENLFAIGLRTFAKALQLLDGSIEDFQNLADHMFSRSPAPSLNLPDDMGDNWATYARLAYFHWLWLKDRGDDETLENDVLATALELTKRALEGAGVIPFDLRKNLREMMRRQQVVRHTERLLYHAANCYYGGDDSNDDDSIAEEVQDEGPPPGVKEYERVVIRHFEDFLGLCKCPVNGPDWYDSRIDQLCFRVENGERLYYAALADSVDHGSSLSQVLGPFKITGRKSSWPDISQEEVRNCISLWVGFTDEEGRDRLIEALIASSTGREVPDLAGVKVDWLYFSFPGPYEKA